MPYIDNEMLEKLITTMVEGYRKEVGAHESSKGMP